jgi:hypothetical protein
MTPDDAVTVLFNFTPPNPPSPLNNSGETIVPTYDAPTITGLIMITKSC